jgi:hypothetical protein
MSEMTPLNLTTIALHNGNRRTNTTLNTGNCDQACVAGISTGAVVFFLVVAVSSFFLIMKLCSPKPSTPVATKSNDVKLSNDDQWHASHNGFAIRADTMLMPATFNPVFTDYMEVPGFIFRATPTPAEATMKAHLHSTPIIFDDTAPTDAYHAGTEEEEDGFVQPSLPMPHRSSRTVVAQEQHSSSAAETQTWRDDSGPPEERQHSSGGAAAAHKSFTDNPRPGPASAQGPARRPPRSIGRPTPIMAAGPPGWFPPPDRALTPPVPPWALTRIPPMTTPAPGAGLPPRDPGLDDPLPPWACTPRGSGQWVGPGR